MRQILWTAIAMSSACSGSAPAKSDIQNWTLAATPSVTIGTREADPGHELARVSGARLQGGWIVVANSGSHEIQRFDSTGNIAGIEGRKGRGPGEFEGIMSLSPAPADSLYVFDTENQRWSVHDGAGRNEVGSSGECGKLGVD